MYISRILISNYKSVKQCDLQLKNGKNVLIGKNSSGKSNIIEAINILFGERFPSRYEIVESDFYINPESSERAEEISIFARLEGEGVNIEILKSQRGLWLFPLSSSPIRKIDSMMEVNPDIFLPLDEIRYPEMEWESLRKRWIKSGTRDFEEVLSKIVDSPYYYFAYSCKSKDDYNNLESDFRFIFKDESDGRHYVAVNMQYNFREAFTNSAVMPAFRDPNIQMRIVNYNWYGKLMRKTWEEASRDPAVSQNMSEVVVRMSEIGQPIFNNLTEDLNRKINIGFSGAKIRFQFLSSHRQDMHKNVRVYINDGIDDLITRKGSGTQSAFIIGLFTYYCMSAHNTSILVVEEPEVFLHPHARRSISRRLDEFVRLKAGEGKTNQVIVTTHSSEIIQTGGVETISLIKRDENGTSSRTFVFAEDFDQQEIRGILKTGASEMLFADKVVICEGAEEFLLSRVADLESGKNGYMDDHNISVINAGGKKYVATMARILDKLGIDWCAIVDFDFLDNTAISFLRRSGRNSDGLRTLVDNWHADVQRVIGRNLSQVLKGASINSVNPSIVDSANSVIERFKEEYRLWILPNGSFEDYITEYGKDNLFDEYSKIDPSKLISVCLDAEINIEDFFTLKEYREFLVDLEIVEKQLGTTDKAVIEA